MATYQHVKCADYERQFSSK